MAFEKGLEYYRKGEFSAALSNFNIALEYGFERDAYELRADCLTEFGDYEEAIRDYDKAISQFSEDCNI
jgi:tetratricopeptide (TPR) repeat protein